MSTRHYTYSAFDVWEAIRKARIELAQETDQRALWLLDKLRPLDAVLSAIYHSSFTREQEIEIAQSAVDLALAQLDADRQAVAKSEQRLEKAKAALDAKLRENNGQTADDVG